MSHLRLVRPNDTVKRLEAYLDQCAFRDYELLPFHALYKHEKRSAIGVHQQVWPQSLELCVDTAIETFLKDGYPMIYFYVTDLK